MEMSTNSTPSSNVSLPPPPFHHSSSNSSNNTLPSSCFSSTPGSSIFAAFTVTNVLLLLPLSIFVLALGFRRWRKKSSSASVNPTDIYTYHMVALELIAICGSVSCSCGSFKKHMQLIKVGCNLFAIISCVKMFFHVLTCVERYLAVVHPITYMHLSKTSGTMIRNISVMCVWVLCFGLLALRLLIDENFNIMLFFCNLIISIIVISSCSLSVLRVLNQSGPGDGGKAKGKVDQSKQKAFYTITIILAVLLLRFTGNVIGQSLALSSVLSPNISCVVQMSAIWSCLPTSYVLPLLFLHRAGKLLCFKNNSESE